MNKSKQQNLFFFCSGKLHAIFLLWERLDPIFRQRPGVLPPYVGDNTDHNKDFPGKMTENYFIDNYVEIGLDLEAITNSRSGPEGKTTQYGKQETYNETKKNVQQEESEMSNKSTSKPKFNQKQASSEMRRLE